MATQAAAQDREQRADKTILGGGMNEKDYWFPFEPQKWLSDEKVSACSLSTQGVWIRILCKMHSCEPRGYFLVNGIIPDSKLAAKIIGITEEEYVNAASELDLFGVWSRDNNGAVYNRRMVRQEQKREHEKQLDRERQKKCRERKKSSVTDESRSSNGHKDKDNNKDKEKKNKDKSSEPSAAPVDNSKKGEPDTEQKIRIVSEAIYRSKKFDKVNAWVNWAKRHYANHNAILHCLESLYRELSRGQPIKDPFAYCSKILKVEHGNYNEREAVAKHEAMKEDMRSLDGLKVADLCKSMP